MFYLWRRLSDVGWLSRLQGAGCPGQGSPQCTDSRPCGLRPPPPRRVESSQTRDRACVPRIGRQALNHWTSRGQRQGTPVSFLLPNSADPQVADRGHQETSLSWHGDATPPPPRLQRNPQSTQMQLQPVCKITGPCRLAGRSSPLKFCSDFAVE